MVIPIINHIYVTQSPVISNRDYKTHADAYTKVYEPKLILRTRLKLNKQRST